MSKNRHLISLEDKKNLQTCSWNFVKFTGKMSLVNFPIDKLLCRFQQRSFKIVFKIANKNYIIISKNRNTCSKSTIKDTGSMWETCSNKITTMLLLQKQPPEVFYKKGVLKSFGKFTGSQLY